MYCKYCGKEIADGLVFCKYCGKKLTSEEKLTEIVSENKELTLPTVNEKKSINKWLIIVPTIIIAIGVVGFALYNKSNSTGKISNLDEIPVQSEVQPTEAPQVTPVATPAPKVDYKEKEPSGKNQELPILDDKDNEDSVRQQYVERKVNIEYATATSYLGTVATDGQTYEPEHIIDGDYTTAWIEGKDTLGIGESVSLEFGEIDRIKRMLIYNGFLNTKYRYAVNGKVTRLLAEFSDGTSKTIEVNIISVPEDKVPFGKDEMSPTEIVFDVPISAKNVKLTVLDAVAGTKYNDVAISEVEIYHEINEKDADIEENSGNEDAIKVYTDYFMENYTPTEYGSYIVKLGYLDEDDIPEMFVMEDFDMGIISVLQYADGKICSLGNYEMLDYIPKKNDIIDSWCDGETSEEVRYHIVDHQFVAIEGVSSTYESDDLQHYYHIDLNEDRAEITEEEYNNNLKKLRQQGVYVSLNQERFFSSVEEASHNLTY